MSSESDWQGDARRRPARVTSRRFSTAPARAVHESDWIGQLRFIDRLRKLAPRANFRPTEAHLEHATFVSFKLEGIQLSRDQLAAAMHRDAGRRAFRSRFSQRLRNHVANLIAIERLLRSNRRLDVQTVLAWYTSVSCGLSSEMPAGPKMERLRWVVDRVETPNYQIGPAVDEIARLHIDLLQDELSPSFAGILARLILTYHLGRCGLPPVVFDEYEPLQTFDDESQLAARIVQLVHKQFEAIS